MTESESWEGGKVREIQGGGRRQGKRESGRREGGKVRESQGGGREAREERALSLRTTFGREEVKLNTETLEIKSNKIK